MKGYLIWLRGGGCIAGEATEMECTKMLWDFEDNRVGKRKYTDKNGCVVVDFSEVIAVGVNALEVDKDILVGFRRN